MQGCELKSSPPLENEFDPSDQKSSGDIELGINLGAAFIPPGDSQIQNYKLNWIQLRPIKSMTEAGGVPKGLSITMKVRSEIRVSAADVPGIRLRSTFQ